MGAVDYVAKPFHLEEVRARVSQALDKRRLVMENRSYQKNLEERVEVQARRIEELFLEGVHALVFALEAKDAYTRGHSMRVANYSVEIARTLKLDTDLVDTIALGSELHDVGKIGVSESVLHKAGKLSDAEYRHIMEHTVIGARILGPLMRDAPGALSIVRSHHERLDGRGFPDGLKGDAIPFEARLVSVADAFDAMTSVRPYRPSLSVQQAMHELEQGKGVQFDPVVVDAFLRAFPGHAALPIPTPQLQPLRLPTRAMEARRA
jgi:putative nucleotidyltransferase with HDIG domain